MILQRTRDLPLEHRLVAVLVAVFGALALLSALSMLFGLPRQVIRFFDVGGEMNLWTWANVVVLALAALAHAAAGRLRQVGGLGRALPWFLSALVLTALSIDDFVALHEQTARLGRAMGAGEGLTHFAWIVPGVFMAAACILAFLPLMLKSDRGPRLLVVLATVLLFGGAIGFEAISGLVASRELGPHLYFSLMHVEEMLEATGASFFLAAGAAELRLRRESIAHWCQDKP